MPYEIDMNELPAGYVLTPARAGEHAKVVYCEFTSTEDGQYFIKRLEGSINNILEKLPREFSPSQVDHLLVVYQSDKKATVYVNELSFELSIRTARAVEAGQEVRKSDIADIESFQLGVEIPDDASFLFLFSVGWRRGLFYDFGPTLGAYRSRRQYSISDVLAQAYSHVLFQEIFGILDEEWSTLFSAKWFPFAGLSNETIEGLLSHIRSDWDPDEKLDDIASELECRLLQMLDDWGKKSIFMPHIEILERAVERFMAQDFMSCTSLLFPRIEGIIRTHRISNNNTGSLNQGDLARSAVAAKIDRESSLLLPRRFASYLEEVYFANFEPSELEVPVSRNSIGHGVAKASDFNKKSAVIGLLIVHQLFYFLQDSSGPDND